MANIDSVKLPNGNEYNLQDVVTPRTAASQPNLLINGWFTVNQRGLSTYSGGSQYTADRWKLDYAGSTSSAGVSSSGITINNISTYTFIEQKFESVSNLLNRPLTASILFSDGTIKSGTAIYDGTASINFLPTTEDVRLQMSYPANSFRIVSYSSSPVTIRAVKLEIGSTSTLHLDTAPDYTTELLKCQRYFIRKTTSTGAEILGYIIGEGSTTAKWTMLLPVEMRTTPTISTTGDFRAIGQGIQIGASSALSVVAMDKNLLVLETTFAATLSLFYPYYLCRTSNNTIDLSAEL